MSFGSPSRYPSYGATTPRLLEEGNETDVVGFNQLYDRISSNLFSINTSASGLERALKQLGTQNDSRMFRDRIHETQKEANKIISEMPNLLTELSKYIKPGDRPRKLQLERLKNEFQDTVQRYYALQKQVATKQKQLLDSKPEPEKKPKSGLGWKLNLEEEEEEERQSLVDEEKRMQQQQMLEAELELEQAFIREREARIREIEADMLDINEVYRDLAAMVHEQGETINSIEANVIQAADNVDMGRQQLSKASDYQPFVGIKEALSNHASNGLKIEHSGHVESQAATNCNLHSSFTSPHSTCMPTENNHSLELHHVQKKYRTKLCYFIVILLVVAAVVAIIVYVSIPKKK